MKFRPCIDLHQGVVKQIVGSTLSENSTDKLETNFASTKSASWYAKKYMRDELSGGHVIRLGPGNDQAAREALCAWPGGLQLGGGINNQNAVGWLDAGADKVIVTSFIFQNGQVHENNLKTISNLIGKDNLVLDLSCRKKDGRYWIVTDRWQKFTQIDLTPANLDYFARYCCEFLIHAVDVEGKSSGIETDLLLRLGKWERIPVTYAGGVRSWSDIKLISDLGENRIDFTVGSALDIFGGNGLKYKDLIEKTESLLR